MIQSKQFIAISLSLCFASAAILEIILWLSTIFRFLISTSHESLNYLQTTASIYELTKI